MSKLWAIADLHLSFDSDKPMDIFGKSWENYEERLKAFWLKNVSSDDVIIIAGDISWALKIDDAIADLRWIEALPGRKLLFKGNHEHWWSSLAKLNALGLDLEFMQNDSKIVDCLGADGASKRIAIVGTRGWKVPEGSELSPEDQKIYDRELLRLRMSFESLGDKDYDQIVMVIHFPPFNRRQEYSSFIDIAKEFGASTIVYGHLHGKDAEKNILIGEHFGINFQFVAIDWTDCKLVQLF